MGIKPERQECNHSTCETEHIMKWFQLLQILTLLSTIALALGSEGKCTGERKGQECVPYRKCMWGKKLFGRILAANEGEEKDKLFETFKDARCGDFKDKTICCDVEGVTYIGTFENVYHNVGGDVYTVDGIDNQIQVRRFTYDGASKDSFFWAGTEGTEPIGPDSNSDNGFILDYQNREGRIVNYFYNGKIPVLPEFTGREDPITLTLPGNRKAKDLKWLSVWDRQWETSHGTVQLSKNDRQG